MALAVGRGLAADRRGLAGSGPAPVFAGSGGRRPRAMNEAPPRSDRHRAERDHFDAALTIARMPARTASGGQGHGGQGFDLTTYYSEPTLELGKKQSMVATSALKV